MIPMWENIFRGDRREKTIEESLRRNILFQDLTSREVRFVQQIVNVRSYTAGETVFQEGEIGVGMYIVVSGRIEILTGTESGTPNSVTTLSEGDFFGEIALVEDGGRRTATAIAKEDAVLIGFFRPDLFEVISRNPVAGVKVLSGLSRVLGTRLAETTALLRQMRAANR